MSSRCKLLFVNSCTESTAVVQFKPSTL